MPKADVKKYQIIQSLIFAHNIAQGIRGCVIVKSMDLANVQREVTFAPHV